MNITDENGCQVDIYRKEGKAMSELQYLTIVERSFAERCRSLAVYQSEYEQFMPEIFNRLEQARKELAEQRWIPVSGAIPQIGDPIYIFGTYYPQSNNPPEVIATRYGYFYGSFTHWMPRLVPPPPSGEPGVTK